MLDIVYHGVKGKFVSDDEYERIVEKYLKQKDLINELLESLKQ